LVGSPTFEQLAASPVRAPGEAVRIDHLLVVDLAHMVGIGGIAHAATVGDAIDLLRSTGTRWRLAARKR
jgi:hypothetical protein